MFHGLYIRTRLLGRVIDNMNSYSLGIVIPIIMLVWFFIMVIGVIACWFEDILLLMSSCIGIVGLRGSGLVSVENGCQRFESAYLQLSRYKAI